MTTDVATLTAERNRLERTCEELRIRNAQLQRSQANLSVQMRMASLAADVGLALTGADDVAGTLQVCAQAIVDRLDAAFARIWTLNEKEQMLELRATRACTPTSTGRMGACLSASSRLA
jgi:hypothetical protein